MCFTITTVEVNASGIMSQVFDVNLVTNLVTHIARKSTQTTHRQNTKTRQKPCKLWTLCAFLIFMGSRRCSVFFFHTEGSLVRSQYRPPIIKTCKALRDAGFAVSGGWVLLFMGNSNFVRCPCVAQILPKENSNNVEEHSIYDPYSKTLSHRCQKLI